LQSGVLLTGVVLAAMGCGGNPPPPGPSNPRAADGATTDVRPDDSNTRPPPKKQSTPRDALLRAVDGLFKPDETLLLKTVKADDDQTAYLKARVELVQAGLDFRDAFVKAYGKDAWDKFQEPKQWPEKEEFSISLVDWKREREFADKVPIDDKGDEAFGELADDAGRRKRCRLIKPGDDWLVDAASITPTQWHGAGNNHSGNPAARAELIRKYQRAVGKPNIKPEDVHLEMALALIRLKGFDAPSQRFDVDKLKD
jgi:hypothetical protein